MEIIHYDPNSKASSITLCHPVSQNMRPCRRLNLKSQQQHKQTLKDLQPPHSAHQENECDLLPHHPIPSLNSQ